MCVFVNAFQFTPLREGRPEMPDYWLRAPGYFNSRPSARGDPPHMPMAGKETYFNSRRSARGDRAYRRGWSISRYFNSRPSARGDAPDTHSTESSKGNFNSRPSARGDYDKAEEIVNVITFQFTPLREGRRATFPVLSRCIVISIHAPPRGATCVTPSVYPCPPHFNSRPSARGDGAGVQYANVHRQFQFTPLREGRRAGNGNRLLPPEISIHAPPRGATLDALLAASKAIHFNSRPSARGDASRADLSADGILFQFTPLREGRLLRGKYAQGVHNFNSRPSARGDH